MKQFILFLFFTTISFGFAKAQDNFEDEFIDPGFQVEPTVPNSVKTEPTPMQIESNEIKNNTSFPTEVNYVESQADEKAGAVLLEKQRNLNSSYKQRRGRHGLLASVTYEKYYPTDYFSQYRDVYIEDIIGSDKINLIGGELGYKLNFKLGSLGLLANFARGSIQAKGSFDVQGVATKFDRTINISRLGASANLALDNFFEEPWVVPYGQVGLHQFQIEENDKLLPNVGSQAATTGLALNYKFGLLFQLNWIEKSIDPSTQIDGLRSSGLENTFLDVYMASHLASSDLYDPSNAGSDGDPDLSSNMELGVGLKMEF